MTTAALLPRVRELACQRLSASLDAGLTKAPQDLMALGAGSQRLVEHRILADAITIAQASRAKIVAGFEERCREFFDLKMARVAGRESRGTSTALSLDALTLVDDVAIEREIAVGKLVRKTRDELDGEALYALEARLGALIGGERLEADENPVGPEVAFDALRLTCETVAPDPAVQTALLNALQPHLAAGLRGLCQELNQMLVAAGVMPRIRHAVQRAPDAPAAAGGPGPYPAMGMPGAGGMSTGGMVGAMSDGMPVMAAHPAAQPSMTLSQALSLRELLPNTTASPIDLGAIVATILEGPPATRQYGARMLADPSGLLFLNAMATPANPELVASLSHMQGAVEPMGAIGASDLLAVVHQLARARQHPLDQLTGELVAVVFDFLLNDPDLPAPVKAELARLQIVAFKAAILDRSFFARREHPLRELLAGIAEAGADPAVDTAPDGRFVTGLRAIVDELVRGFKEDLAPFELALERVKALALEPAPEGDAEFDALAARLEEQERVEAATRAARLDLERRLTPEVPEFVRDFLVDVWSRSLADAEIKSLEGEDSRPARLAIAESLIRSLRPHTRDEVAAFTASLPKLVKGLERGMAAVEFASEERRAFFGTLMARHTEILHAARTAVRAPGGPPPVMPSGVVPAPELAAPEAPMQALLECGALVEFREGERPVRMKLAWVSPRCTLYAFRSGRATRSLTADALAAGMREGAIVVVEGRGEVVERALAAVVGAR